MTIRITWRRALTVLAGLVLAGFAVAWSGVIHIGASTGHAAITDWFLHWAMRNTVRTYAALTVETPAADPSGLVSAAGHYAGNCAVCHGAPGEPPSPQMQAATPPAPDLAITAPSYTDAELFWIVKHGVKLTGMPAWPALEREDEIRRMTAFVRRLPEMSEQEYRVLAYGPAGTLAGARPTTLDGAIAECERCHAEHGRAQPDIPILAGQKPAYLLDALEDFAAGRRDSGVMQTAAARVGERLRGGLAEHYARRTGLVEKPMVEPAERERSAPDAADATPASVVAHGIPELDVPPCANCHAPGKRDDYPILAGQKAEYLAGRLRNWRRGEETVDARRSDEPMPMIARRIPERLIEPLARYFGEL
jgi:cytochrome c553